MSTKVETVSMTNAEAERPVPPVENAGSPGVAAAKRRKGNGRRTATRYRTRYEIMETILRTASQEGGTTKTRLMYSAYLSYDQTNETLADAEEWGLLTKVARGDHGETKSLYVYKATPQALEWLRTYAHLVELQGGKSYRD